MFRLAALAALFVSGCASVPVAVMPASSVGDLLGRTQGDIRTRLGASDDGEHHFRSLRFENGAEISSGGLEIFVAPDPCPGRAVLRWLELNDRGAYPTFTFRDGLLSEIRTKERVLDATDRVAFLCGRAPSFYNPTATEMVLGPFLAPVAVAAAPFFILGEAVGDTMDQSDERDHAASALRLGEPLPGGLSAFLSRHDDVVRVLRQDGQDADLAFEVYDDGYLHDQTILAGRARNVILLEVRGGALTRIDARSDLLCRITAAHAIICPGRSDYITDPGTPIALHTPIAPH